MPGSRERKLNERKVQNVRDTLKTLWQVGMLGAMFEVAKRYGESFSAIDDASFTWNFFHRIFSEDSMYFVSFVLCFLRFFVGDSRMLDLSYIESTRRDGFRNTMKKFTPMKQACDLALLVIHAFFFHLMAVNIEKHTTYLSFFFCLSAVNILWLGLVLREKGWVLGEFDPLTGMKKDWQILFWATNNAVWLVLSLVTWCLYNYNMTIFYEQIVCVVYLFYSIANSIVDIAFTRNFYFPRLHLLGAERSPAISPPRNRSCGGEDSRGALTIQSLPQGAADLDFTNVRP